MRASPLADSGGPSYAAAGALRSGAASLRTTLPRAACTAGRRFFPEGSIRIAATMTLTPSHFPTEQRSPRERWRAGWQVTATDREHHLALRYSATAALNRKREIGALKTHRPGDIGPAVGGAGEGGFSGAAPSAGAAGATFGSAAGGGSSLLRGGLTQLRTQCPGTHRPERVW
jgi:hypothetical protein